MSRPRHGARSERGFLAGSDGVLFGVLILVAGTLAIVDAWRIVEHHTALRAAAHEYLRTYTEQPDPSLAGERAEVAARRLLAERGTPLRGLRIQVPTDATFGPCSIATVTMSAPTPRSSLPFVTDLLPSTVTVEMSELIDPHRELLPGPAHDPELTPCG